MTMTKSLKSWQTLRKWRWNRTYFITTQFLFGISIALLLSACGEQESRIPDDPFIPPSLVPKINPTPTQDIKTIQPSPAAACENDLKYVEDVNVPDGTRFAPRSSIEKVWLVKNEGSCNWEAGYTIRLVSGPDFGADAEQALFPARSGSEVEIRILFEAPGAPGNYVSKWQAFDPSGEPFGEIIFIDFNVDIGLVITPSPPDSTDEP